MMRRLYFITLILTMVLFADVGNAASVPDGAIIVRIDDGATSRCINSTTDRITMHLRRLVVNKDVGIFTEDKTAAVIVSTMISGEESGTTPKKVSFPRMYIVTVAPYTLGYVSLPIEEKLFSRFPLTNSSNSYDTAEIEFTILAKKGRTPFGVALSALADITKNLPAPMNPFSEGFKYFSNYANKVVEGSLSTENNISQSSKEGKITLSFSSTATCAGDQETTGTLAIVRGAKGLESDGFIDIKKDYCWKAELKPVFTLKFATPVNGTSCNNLSADSFKHVGNPYIAFYLNAEPKNPTVSSNLQIRTIALPAKGTLPVKLSAADVEKSVVSAYATIDTASTTHLATLKKISKKVNTVIEDPAFISKVATSPSTTTGNAVFLSITLADSLVIDLAESLNRCSAHGIAPKNCL